MSKLHLVFGGRVDDPRGLDFTDLESIDLVGIYDSYAAAEEAWRSSGAADAGIFTRDSRFVTMQGNTATGGAVNGGGVYNRGQLTIEAGSSVRGNTPDQCAGDGTGNFACG